MGNNLQSILLNFSANDPCVNSSIENVEKHFGCLLPQQYKSFMSTHDGGEGFIGARYLILWRIGKLIEFNRDYEAAKYAPGFLLFGSSGGGEAFAFDMTRSDMKIRMVPFIGLSPKNAVFVADTFEHFLNHFAKFR